MIKLKLMNNILYLILIAAVCFVLFSSCKDSISGSDVDNIIMPDSNVSYSQFIQPLFNIKCTSSGCHDDGSKAGGLSLTTWANTTADFQVVAPGLPDNSKLIWAIEGTAGVSIMPPIGAPITPLTTNHINGIRTWIKEGAKPN